MTSAASSAAPGQGVDASVVMPAFEASRRVGPSLSHLADALRGAPFTWEILVVDDGSRDGTSSAAEATGLATVLRSETNRGASAARNLGATTARGEWLLFIDDDVRATPAAVAALWAARRPGRCAVPAVRRLGGELENSTSISLARADLKVHTGGPPHPAVAYPVGSCFLVERAVYWAVGGFDERYYPNYFEDTAFGLELWLRGFAVDLVMSAEMAHDHHGGDRSPERVRRLEDHVFKNRWLFAATVLSGWRRQLNIASAIPRCADESRRLASPRPLYGLARGWRAALRRRRPVATAPRVRSLPQIVLELERHR